MMYERHGGDMQQWTVMKDVSEIRSCTEEEYHARVSKIEATLKQAVDRYTARSNRATGQTEYLHGALNAVHKVTKTV